MMVSYLKVGTKNDGTITAVDIKNIFAVFQCTPGVEHLVDNTRIPNLRCNAITADGAKTGLVGSVRTDSKQFLPDIGFDDVAAELDLDPTLVALKNDGCEGHDMDWLSKYKKSMDFQIGTACRMHRGRQKENRLDNNGIHPAPKNYPTEKCMDLGLPGATSGTTRGTGSAAVWMENDGTVSIVSNHPDVGVNPWTTYCQVVADELGVPVQDVTIKPFDGDHIFALMSPDGFCNLCSNAFIVPKAARKARALLLDLAINFFEGLSAEDLDIRDRFVFEKNKPENKKSIKEITAMSMPMHNAADIWTEAPIVGWAWHQQGIWGDAMETGRPRLCRQAHFMEVEVDTETGQVAVTKVVNANDVGKAISPESVEGQMYGGTYMGVGRALTEEMVWDPQTGVLLNRNLLDYKIATIKDCPKADTAIVETVMGMAPMAPWAWERMLPP